MAQKDFQLDPDVKVGTATVIEDTYKRVIFDSPFRNVPKVFLTVNDDVQRHCHLQVENLVLEEFYLRVVKTQGGSAVTRTVAWLAMDYE